MGNEYLIGLDVGTTATKAVVFGTSGNVVSSESREFSVAFPKAGWAESDLEDIWKETATAIREALAKEKIDPHDIRGVGVTNQRETIAAVDKGGNALRNAISWQDRRALGETEWILKRVSRREVYQTTGIIPSTWSSAPKILWVKNNEPEIYTRAYKWLTVHDWIILKLSGVFSTDWTNASRLMMFDLKKLRWSDKLLEACEIDAEKLPETHPPGTVIGEVTDGAAKLTGLAKGTPVVLGAGDQQCSALGVGVVRSGRISMCSGASLVIEVYAGDEPLFDPNMSCLATCHALPGKYLLETGNGACGLVYKWFRDNLGQAETQVAKGLGIDPYQILDAEAEKIPPGSEGIIVYTYFEGGLFPYFTFLERGMILGLLAKHTKSHLARAILEGVSYKARHSIESAERVLGSKVSEVRHMGGGAKSKIWNSIFANVLGNKVAIPTVTESGALGAAMLAGLGVGIYKDLEKAADEIVKIRQEVEPSNEISQIYDKLYTKIYLQVYDRVADYVRELSRMKLG